MKKEKWIMSSFSNGGKDKLIELSKQTGLNPVIAGLLLKRGVDTPEKARKIFNFTQSDIPNTSLMADADKAVEEIHKAIKNYKTILVWADYDVDGIMSGSILINSLRNLGADVKYCTSNRFHEGYGISVKAINRVLKEYPTVDFVITVDNGIVAFDAIEELNRRGKGCVILDHHEPSDDGRIPNALAVCDAKRLDDKYPFKDICGAGLAYKIMRHLYSTYGYDVSFVDSMLDLVGTATIADMVTLKEENRYYVKKGLELIKNQSRLAMAILINDLNGFNRNMPVDETLIGYYVAPALNAEGRMEGNATKAIELFTAIERHTMEVNSKVLVALNEERKDATAQEFEIAKKQIEENQLYNDNVIVVMNEDFQEGLVGLVAGRIKEEYGKPTIVLTENDGIYKGSARSVEGFHIKSVLDSMKETMIGYGGHAMAAGVSLEKNMLQIFIKTLNQKAEEMHLPDEKTVYIDVILKPRNITVGLIETLEQLAPFGQGFEKPVIGLSDVRTSRRERMGKGDNPPHLKIYDDESNLPIIDFNGADYYESIGSPVRLKCIGYPNKNVFRNNVTAQFLVSSHRIKADL